MGLFVQETEAMGINAMKLDIARWPKLSAIVAAAKGNARKAIMDLELDIAMLDA